MLFKILNQWTSSNSRIIMNIYIITILYCHWKQISEYLSQSHFFEYLLQITQFFKIYMTAKEINRLPTKKYVI